MNHAQTLKMERLHADIGMLARKTRRLEQLLRYIADAPTHTERVMRMDHAHGQLSKSKGGTRNE